MITKKHLSPANIFSSFFTIDGCVILYFGMILMNSNEKPTFLMYLPLYLGAFMMIIAPIGYFMSKKNKVGDELTSEIIQKGGYLTFIITLFLLFFVMAINVFTILFNKEKILVDGISSVLDPLTIISLFSLVIIISTFIFMLYYIVASKKGTKLSYEE